MSDTNMYNQNKEERFSRVSRISYTRYSAEGSKREMEIYKQQSGIVKRHLCAISIYGNVGGRQI